MSDEPLNPKLLTVFQYGLTILAGALLAVILHKLWSLDTRHLAVVAIGIMLISVSVFFIPRFSDFLLVSLFFSIPVTGFVKSLFLTSAGYAPELVGVLLYSGAIGIGPVDLLLWALYMSWFIRIFLTRQETPPRFERADGFVLLLVAAYALSTLGTPDKNAAIFSVGYLLRFVMVYFYISRNFQPRHIPWLFTAFFVIITLEALLAMFQFSTGKLIGLAMDRGSGVRIHDQYSVPGIEHRNRATGTSYESHTFGLFMSMLAQFAFVMMATTFYKMRHTLISTVLFGLAIIAVLVSFSRSAWLSCAFAVTVSWFVHIRMWKEKKILKPTLAMALVLLILSPWILSIFIERFASAGGQLLLSRFDQFPVAWDIWSDHFLFGYGVGNYMEALEIYNIPGILALPVHNVLLWIGAESGLLGVVAFYGLLFNSMARSWRIVRSRHEPYSQLALAVFCALCAYFLDGLTDPLYREPTVYMLFWVLVGLSAALVRIAREDSQNPGLIADNLDVGNDRRRQTSNFGQGCS